MKKHRILLLTLLILLLGLVWSVYSSRYRLQITYDSLTSSSLPRGFDGYRIVQLTDLHAAEFGENNCKLVEKIQALRPDMISMTGDFIEQESDISVTETLIAQLTDIAPVYVVSGNHDWASGAANELRAAIESAGGVWLGNSCRELTKNNDRIILAGVEDPNSYAEMIQPDELMDQIALAYPDTFTILLAHRNDWPEKYPNLQADLILCGHGHGGVIRLPFVGGLLDTTRTLFPAYDAGLFPCNRYTMVVSRGLGGNFPIPRLWNRPEILCLDLYCA